MIPEFSYLLENILQTFTDSESSQQSLDRVVQMLAEYFQTDVCSVYVYTPYSNTLTLKATVGLSKESVDTIEMDVNEGLTGLVIETMAPVFIVNPADHPRYKYYEGSGEEIYHTYLGVPLIYHRKVVGALVVQTRAEKGIDQADIPLLKSIAGQIAAAIALTILEEDWRPSAAAVSAPVKATADDPLPSNHLRGEAVSDRVAFGYARFFAESIDFDHIHPAVAIDPAAEAARLEQAFAAAAEQIREVSKMVRGISAQEKAILDAHCMFLADHSLRDKILAGIHNGHNAEYALKKVVFEYVDMFQAMDDPYLSERYADVLDIGRRVLGNLVGRNETPGQAFTRETILVAADISPVDLMAIRQPNLKGLVLTHGGRTSHTVIMAKSLEIPIVIGVEELLKKVRGEDFLIVDGVSGMVYVNPTEDIRETYEHRQAQDRRLLAEQEQLRDLPAETRDGFVVRLGANIGLLSDMLLARKYGADLIGLYRTEFPFLLRKSFPSEAEQLDIYTRMLEKADQRVVTIRTFDVGGDKFLSYLDYPREDNPFLGWRAIRLSLDLEEVFRTQIRAILQASATGRARILFPMITGSDEIRKVKSLVEEEKHNLTRAGLPFDPELELGIMVEVPAAVPILDRLLRYVDFVNIGTNDLTQYLLAVDRNNKKVSRHFNVLHPSVIATVEGIVSVCRQQKKPVCVCGEAAAIRESLYLFLGMGADSVSMVPAAIPRSKQFLRSVRQSDAAAALAACLQMEDSDEIAVYLKQALNGSCC